MDLPEFEGLSAGRTKPDVISVRLSSPSRASFLALLRWLPEGWDLEFYDQYYPSMSDPGAYVSVQRSGDLYVYWLGNHGWSADWQKQSPELLAAWMHLNTEPAGPFSTALKEVTVRKALRPWPGSR